MMKNICNPSRLPGFCDYFAELTGFDGKTQMFGDVAFMSKCREFADAVYRSAENRNNASHGGSYISIIQCTYDRKAVLNNLESVRSTSIGLIQQLLYVLHST